MNLAADGVQSFFGYKPTTMKTLLSLTLLAMLLTACATSPQSAPDAQAQIPAGPGKWVKVDTEIPLESMVGKRVVLPYGSRGLVSGADKAQVVTYSIAFTADPFAANDRCAMTVVALIQTTGDGTTQEVPAHGTVVDNSDSRPGFRIEFSTVDPKQLVIPANASAAVIFSQPVTLPSAMSAAQ